MHNTQKILLNRYEITEELLKGRFSTIYYVLDNVLGTPLVIRQLDEVLPEGSPQIRNNARIQFFREGRTLSGLSHRNLPRILDIIEEQGRVFLLMEDFRGMTIEAYINQNGSPDERILHRWMNQFISVLDYLHTRTPPIIHRDINPGNIFITPHGVIKIAEFGISRISETSDPGKTLFRSEGNPVYAAPEQLLQMPSSPANDIYSLGALFYYIASGVKPRNSLERIRNPHEDQKLSILNPSISEGFSHLISSMMVPDMESRIPSAAGLREEWLKILPPGLSISIPLVSKEAKPPHTASSGETATQGEKRQGWDDIFNVTGWFRKEAAPAAQTQAKQDVGTYPLIDISKMQLDREIGSIIPEGVSKSIGGIVIGKRSSREITVAVVDPAQIHIYDHISYATRGLYRPVIMRADPVMVNLAREYIYKCTAEKKSWLEWLEQKKYEVDKLDVKSISGEDSEIFRDDIKGPVIEAADRMIKEAISIGASDIHIETYDIETVVRYRIDGILHQVQTFEPRMGSAISKRIKLTAGMDIAQDRITQGGRISVKVRDREFDLRVSIVPVRNGENIVMRLLNKGAFNYTLSDLGFESHSEIQYRKLLAAPHGMILVSGPTGSGKSTTLYASLSEINKPDRKLITVEDPVEYEMPGITQVQVNLAPREEEKRVTFAKALREFLRQDPDVILVGEIRDPETAAISVQAALTGHLLLSTIHTNDSVGIITRLQDMGIEPYLISSTLAGGIAQRLVRRVCSDCGRPEQPSPELIERFAREDISTYTPARGEGCLKCRYTGSKGRVAVYEILEATPALRTMISSGESADNILKQAKSEGMKTLYQDGLLKVAKGQVTLEEIFKITLID